MATITFKGGEITTKGLLPEVGAAAPDFKLTGVDLQDKSLKDFLGQRIVLNIFPSVDTGVCAASVRRFNKNATILDNCIVLAISKDLPFALSRFCGAEGIDKVISLSEYKDSSFSDAYGVKMTSGPLEGLLSRAVVIIDTDGTVLYAEQVPEITTEPDYETALSILT